MRKSKKKLLAMILAFTMVFGTLPSNAFANNEQEQISNSVEETVATDNSENVENEDPVEDITEETQEEVNTEEVQAEAKVEEEALSEVDSNTEVDIDSSLEEIKLEKTEDVIVGEKYIIVYDNKKALATGKDNIIAVPVEIEGETVKTEITKNMVWTVDENNNLVSELGKKLSAELTLLEHNGQSFEFNEKNVSYVNDEVNNYLTYNEENNKWSFNTEENEAVTYYNVVGLTENLNELSEEELEKLESENSNEQPQTSQEDENTSEVTEEQQNPTETLAEWQGDIESKASCTATEGTIHHFPVTMYNYDSAKINTNTPDGEKKFMFIGTTETPNDGSLPINTNNGGIVQGIVKDTLTDKKTVEFSDGITGPQDLFGISENSVIGKEVYQNVQFPFLYTSDGYYTFDSDENHVHVNKGSKEQQTLQLLSGKQTSGSNYGFFPFNSEDSEFSPDYHFGMNMGVGFYIPEGGIDKNKKDIIFEFSGDDDVWVFIDDKLVLDIGGSHGVHGASINFNTGDITYKCLNELNTGCTNKECKIRDTSGNIIGNIGVKGANDKSTTLSGELYKIISRENLQNSKEHSLQIFYLERGAAYSNCKISFNLPQENKIEVSKSLIEGTPLTENQFEFQLQVEDNGNFIPVVDKEYTLYTGQGITSSGLKTDSSNGVFKLKAGQRAVFYDPIDKKEYRVVEINGNDYKTKWSTSIKGTDGSSTDLSNNIKESPSITIDNSENINTYIFYCYNQTDIALVDDTIVLDYGKPINIDVMTNDKKMNPNIPLTLNSIAIATKDDNGNLICGLFNDVNGLSLPLTNGTLTKPIQDGVDFVYTPTKYMDSIERLVYKVNYSVSDGDDGTKTGEKTANLNIMPATTVYYEDNFGSSNPDGTNGIVFSENWSYDGADTVTKQDKDQHKNYGYDSNYANNSTFSGGYSKVVTGVKDSNGNYTTTASFTFKGTGFDLISRTKNDTGSIIVKVTKRTGTDKEGNAIYDEENPVWKTIVNNTYYSGDLYQIPVINFYTDKYEEYKVDITVGETIFYLDAIRVYNPLGLSSANNDDYNDAYTQYINDKEANAVIKEVRNMLISAGDFDVNSGNVGTIFIDVPGGKDGQNTSSVAEYKNIGPNNEVYLAKDQSIAFKVPYSSQLQTVQLGLKATSGKAIVTVGGTVNKALDNYDINTATDMYYDITSSLTKGEDNNYIVVITNTSEKILSVTNLKMTYSEKQNNGTTTVFADEETVIVANMLAYERSSNKSADIDSSGTVDIMDLATVASNQDKEVIIGVSTDIYRQDLTGTRTINREDLNIVRDNIQ